MDNHFWIDESIVLYEYLLYNIILKKVDTIPQQERIRGQEKKRVVKKENVQIKPGK